MQKIFLLFVAAFLCSPFGIFISYADNQPSTPVAGNPMINLNEQDIDKLFKAEEVALKKLKVEHMYQERKQHAQNTDYAYHEAVVLYQQKRLGQAKEVLGNVEDLMPYYKSTDALLKSIDHQRTEELKPKPSSNKPVENPQEVISLEKKATTLYRQAANLGDNENTAGVKKKITRLMESFQQMSQKIYIQAQLKRIAQEADKYQQEIFRLTQLKDYSEAKRKYADFQQTMIDELSRIKQTITLANNKYVDAQKHDAKYWQRKMKLSLGTDDN